ncbi:hypothetical protein [Desulforegula conservatrix]|uniref:hypothetical protein n=1 Tax=Desulforegula conservatrix TaxID=153026 RepID=UPI0004273EE3|nr:hypothetical protein [Desulforegula conservatrix]
MIIAKIAKSPIVFIPSLAGIQNYLKTLDAGSGWHDAETLFLTFCDSIKYNCCS